MSEINVNEELWKLINALMAITPSRNYIAQYIAMMPMDYPSTYDMFPEFLLTSDLRESLGRILGIAYGAEVNIISDSAQFAYNFRSFLERIFALFESSDIRQKISVLTGASDDAIPNPRKEWVEIRLKGIISIPNQGKQTMRTLRLISESLEPAAGWRSFNDLVKLLQLNENEVRRIIDLLMYKYRLIIRDDRGGKEGYRLADDVSRYGESIRQIAESAT